MDRGVHDIRHGRAVCVSATLVAQKGNTEPMLSKKAARAFFLVGTALCSLVFVGLTVDTFRRIPAQDCFDDVLRRTPILDLNRGEGRIVSSQLFRATLAGQTAPTQAPSLRYQRSFDRNRRLFPRVADQPAGSVQKPPATADDPADLFARHTRQTDQQRVEHGAFAAAVGPGQDRQRRKALEPAGCDPSQILDLDRLQHAPTLSQRLPPHGSPVWKTRNRRNRWRVMIAS